MRHLSAILLLALLAGCTPSREACERAYGPCGRFVHDTVITIDTQAVSLPGDTITNVPVKMQDLFAGDTFRLEQGRMWAELYLADFVKSDIDKPGSETGGAAQKSSSDLRLSMGSDPDTVFLQAKNTSITTTKEVITPCDKLRWWELAGMVAGALLLGLTIGYFASKIFS